jgi:hypothetical protein
VSTLDGDPPRAVVGYETGGNTVDLTVTENGLIANFPGLAHLV